SKSKQASPRSLNRVMTPIGSNGCNFTGKHSVVICATMLQRFEQPILTSRSAAIGHSPTICLNLFPSHSTSFQATTVIIIASIRLVIQDAIWYTKESPGILWHGVFLKPTTPYPGNKKQPSNLNRKQP